MAVSVATIQKAAALLGAVGIVAGAYGSHGLPSRLTAMGKDAKEVEMYKNIWRTGNLYHMLHSVAILAAPMLPVSRPAVVAGLMLGGTLLFAGGCYAAAFMGDRKYSKPSPVGGLALIAAWASILVL